jgi:hypothetical protein
MSKADGGNAKMRTHCEPEINYFTQIRINFYLPKFLLIFDCNFSRHVFDHDRPLEPKMLAVEETLPIRGHSPGKILGEFCGKMPQKDPKGAIYIN